MDGWLWETLFQPWIRNFQKQEEWWCPAPAAETPSTSEISNKDGNRNLWKTLKALFSRVINLLLTKLARDRTGRISALGPYCQDLGPIFSQYGPRAWLIRYIYSFALGLFIDGKQKNLNLSDGLYTLSTKSTSFQVSAKQQTRRISIFWTRTC